MASVYAAFLQNPTPASLAADASINYITTTTSISEPAAIIKHLAAQQKQVSKKEEKVLGVIEGPDGLFLETETTLQFHNGGGTYLPNIDDNVLDEKIVTFPLLHVVRFDAVRKIQQIRLYWDQGTLLKQVEAIGRTGRNWPIRDGKAQIEAITKSLHAAGQTSFAPSNRSSVSVRDPQAIFIPRSANDNRPAYEGPTVAPRDSAKPAPREMAELFGDAGNEQAAAPASHAAPVGHQVRSPSPSKADVVTHKGGAGKHFTDNRLFDENDESAHPGLRSPETKKVFNQRYDHFAFGDGEDAPELRSDNRVSGDGRRTGSKAGGPTFDFADFSTPPKHQPKMRRDDEVHWGGENDPESPPKRPIVHAPRKDADTHFLFTDNTPAERQVSEKPKSLQREQGMKLYRNAEDEEDVDRSQPSRETKTATTSTDNSRRSDDFGAHYSMAGAPDENIRPGSNGTSTAGKRATRSDMDAHWSYDGTSLVLPSSHEVVKEKKIYKTAGNGMGSRSSPLSPPEDDSSVKKIYKTVGDGMGGRRDAAGHWWDQGDGSQDSVVIVPDDVKGRAGTARRGHFHDPDADVRPSARALQQS